MTSHLGLRRLRIVGISALALGLLACLATTLTRAAGYGPDPAFAPIFNALFPVGLCFAILGAILSVASWILEGFVGPKS